MAMKTILSALFLISLSAHGQSLSATAAPNTVSVGKSTNIALTYSAGADPAAAVQWSSVLPTGSTIAWTIASGATANGKQLSCTADGTTCLLFGLNETPLSNGVIATAVLSLNPSLKGEVSLTINGALGADPMGMSVVMSGSGAGVFISSPFDLNGDGLVNISDLLLAVQQVLGITTCGTADFNADGKCNILDLELLAIDSLSANP
jgi:hypothetical protein